MADPVTYQSTSPRHQLPLLFAAQAQKEVVINDALIRLDALTHLVVQTQQDDPSPTPIEGQCWIVGSAPTGVWSGHAEAIAAFLAGDWLFLEPHDGMACWHANARQFIHYDGGWQTVAKPAIPSGGSVVDIESRQSIEALLIALTSAGIFSS